MHLCGDSENLVAAYLEGRLRASELAELERHLERCSSCRTELAAIREEFEDLARKGTSGYAGAPARSRPAVLGRAVAALPERVAGVPGIFSKAMSFLAAAGLASCLWVLMVSPGWDPETLRGASLHRLVVATANVGDLRLANGPAAPVPHGPAVRGTDPTISEWSVAGQMALLPAANRYPRDAHIRLMLADFFLASGDIERAVRSYNAAAALAPEDPRIANNLAVAQYMANDPASAVETLGQSLADNPDRVETLYNLAVLSRKLNRIEDAKNYTDRYLAIDGSSPWARRLLARDSE